MNGDSFNEWMIRLYIVLAATAGAVTGVLIDKSLSLQGKVSAFFIGLTASIFLGPLLISRFTTATVTPEIAGFYYIFASCANVALPPFIRYVSRKAGDPLAFLRTTITKDNSK